MYIYYFSSRYTYVLLSIVLHILNNYDHRTRMVMIINEHSDVTTSVLYFVPSFSFDRVEELTSIAKVINCRIIVVTTWAEFTGSLDKHHSIVVVHSRAIKANIGAGLPTFVTMIRYMMGYVLECCNKPLLAVCIDGSCTREFVQELKKYSINGIVPCGDNFSLMECVTSLSSLLDGKDYWPAYIIDKLYTVTSNNSILPLHIYFRDTAPIYVSSTIHEDISNATKCCIKYCTSWAELPALLLQHPRSLMLHDSMIASSTIVAGSFIKMLTDFIKCITDRDDVHIGIAIEPTTTGEFVDELIHADIRAICPSYAGFGREECITGVKALVNDGVYIPAHVIKKLPRYVRAKPVGAIKLTDRQSQILDLICKRGISNKKIASTLNITESTVKIHISAILKAYCVQNRTQLALSVNQTQKV